MPGRNEILRGNRLPRTTMWPARRRTESPPDRAVQIGQAEVCVGDEQRRAPQKIMNTFHSSGTPIGIADRMPKWKHTMTNAAIAVGQPPWEKNNTSGTNISIAVLK